MSEGNHHCDSGEQYSNVEPSAAANELPEVATTNTATATATASDYSSTSSPMAKGLSSVISSVIKDFDNQSQQTIRSQDQLSSAIDRLTTELDKLLEDAPSPFIMQHAVKISGVRKRISSLNSVLKSIQRRLDNIDRLVSAGLPNDKMASETAVQQ